MNERWYCVFHSSLRYDAAPCISHETIDKISTLCGRKVDEAATLESDNNNIEPDCLRCRNSSMKQYEVKCKVPDCYHSRPMGQGTAKEAARMHETLGDQHTCKLIPVKS